jgi:hypothetical protein
MNRNDRVMQAPGCALPPQGEALAFSEASLRPPSELWAKTTLVAQSSAGPGRRPDPAPQRGGAHGET